MSVQIGIAQLQLGNDEITRIMDAALTDVPRAHGEDAAFDLWGKNGTGLPATAVPVLVHEVFCEIEWFEQIIWFNRTETSDELWTFTDLDLDIRRSLNDVRASTRPGCLARFGRHAACAISVPRARDFDESLLELLGCFFTTQAGAPGDIKHLIATAYINKAHFKLLLERVELHRERERLEHEEFSRQAYENETEIIHVARELGLNPEPAGIGPVQWYANCPRTAGHPLRITTSDDYFFCGYCSVSGGVDELRAFVAENRPEQKAPKTRRARSQLRIRSVLPAANATGRRSLIRNSSWPGSQARRVVKSSGRLSPEETLRASTRSLRTKSWTRMIVAAGA